MNKQPIQEPEPIALPDPKGPEIDPMPEGPSSSDPVTASKKVDNLFRHESHHAPKKALQGIQHNHPAILTDKLLALVMYPSYMSDFVDSFLVANFLHV